MIELAGTKGTLRLDPAYSYTEPNAWKLKAGAKVKEHTAANSDQFAPELIHFSDCLLHRRAPEPNGYEGLADVRIMTAIAKSAKAGHAVKLKPVAPQKRIQLTQAMKRPPVKKAKLVNVNPPSE